MSLLTPPARPATPAPSSVSGSPVTRYPATRSPATSTEKDTAMTATLNHPPAVTEVTPPAGSSPAPAVPPRRGRLARLALGPVGDPRWARPALWALLLAAAALYLINLSVSGYANDFYAAAVKSGTQSWTAWLFGSLDSANAITVDKPPASLWIMGLSARLLGFSSFSLLLPQALMGVGTVAVTYAAVKRWSGPAAGLVAGGLVLLTPVAALMFRFDNPDALLVLLMAVAAYFVVRAIETPRGATALRWLLLAGVAIGFAFLTKMLQGLLVLPAFGAAYLLAAPRGLWTRIWHLLAAAGAVVVSAGWFIALVALWPAASRPYIGGSTDNSLWELAIGYNGLGRIFGSEGNGGGGMGGGNTGFGGTAGLGRLFNSAFGSEISWLIPAALVGLVAGAWFTRRYARTDRVRASLILFGGSTVVTALVFSFMAGTIHPYYAVALAPFLAGTVAVSGRELWRGRENPTVRALLGAMIAITGIWSFVLLGRDATFLPWLRWLVVVGAVVGAVLLALGGGRLKKLAVIGLLLGSITALSGTAAWTVATAAQAHSGSIPTSGPASASSGGMGGMGGFTPGAMTGTPPTGAVHDGTLPDGTGTTPGGTGTADGTGTAPGGTTGTTGTTGGTGTAPGGTTGTTRGGMGGGSSTGAELIALLNATDTRWSAAALGSQSAAGYVLNSDTAVMAIGGWGGSDPAPTLAEFQQYVADGDITYFIAGGGMGGGGMGGGGTTSTGSEISAWVTANFTATTVGGTTVYDLTAPTG
ncbi:hypothetical protein GCM10009818_16860 [Nakamurella flavida]|nr:glycosyltransferase family 39 protein [Nakamurella flavida]